MSSRGRGSDGLDDQAAAPHPPHRSKLTADEREVLLATYQIERSDEQSTANLMVGVMAGMVAYSVALAPFLAGLRPGQWPDSLILCAAIPLWILAGVIIFQAVASDLRQHYITHLEALLSEDEHGKLRTYPRYTALQRGLFATGGWRNLPHILLAAFTFSTPLLVSIAFTSFLMIKVSNNVQAGRTTVLTFWVVYVALGLLVFWVLGSIRVRPQGRRDRLNLWATRLLQDEGRRT